MTASHKRAHLAGVALMDADMDRIRSALFSLSPDMPRSEWAEIGMALKSGLGEGGRELFQEWSHKSKKYDARDVRDTWRSIKSDGGITLATLFYRAKQAGWHYNGAGPTREEIERGRRETAERAKAEKERRARERAEAAKQAAQIWKASTPVLNHPYLLRKGLSPVETLRQIPADEVGYTPKSRGGTPLIGSLFLVVPIYAGELTSVEFIDEVGNKSALTGGQKGGGYWPAQPLPDGDGAGVTLMIGEGVATVLSAREATGHPAIAALTCTNLKAVTSLMRQRYPLARLLILGDLGNGQKDAEEAAQAAKATLVLPDFGKERNGFKDFNDMHQHQGREAVAECIRRQAPTTTAAEVLIVFKKWLYLPDPGVIYVPLGAVAANLMEGDPVWVMIVGPSSGGKTELIMAIVRLPYVRLGATLTEAALLSGTPKKQKASGSKGGLLREIGKFGILALKDFTSILAMHRDRRAEVLAALREIFDGSWTRDVGTDGGLRLEWSGKMGLIAGCTAAIDSYHGVMSVMGERFLFYRLPKTDPIGQAEQALANTGKVYAMRKELADAVTGLFAGLDIQRELPPIDDSETRKLVTLSSLVAGARSAVERDSYKREIELVLDTEAPARLAQTLRRLYAGMLAIGLDRATAWPLVVKTGLDCVPKLRRAVFDVLADADCWLKTKEVATETHHPTSTAKRCLEDLNAHGVVDRMLPKKGVGDGVSDTWQLSDQARSWFDETKPDKSPPESGDDPPSPSSSPPSSKSTPLHIEEDLSGLVQKTASECGFEGGFGGNCEGFEKPHRHCWSCKAEVGDGERCEMCGWIPCSCGACSPRCGRGAAPDSDVEVSV
jgi:phage/plasmid primase-like uncharacterized protein